MDKYFPQEDFDREQKEREEHAFMLENQMVGQKPASEIRQILRHKKKYETEL